MWCFALLVGHEFNKMNFPLIINSIDRLSLSRIFSSNDNILKTPILYLCVAFFCAAFHCLQVPHKFLKGTFWAALRPAVDDHLYLHQHLRCILKFNRLQYISRRQAAAAATKNERNWKGEKLPRRGIFLLFNAVFFVACLHLFKSISPVIQVKEINPQSAAYKKNLEHIRCFLTKAFFISHSRVRRAAVKEKI